MPLRVAFAGTPEFAAVALEAIVAAGFEVPLVLTQPDRPSGRGMKLTPSPVKKLALAHAIPVDQPDRLRSEEQRAALRACDPDVLVVAAYGLILPVEALSMPRLGCVNIHASLLPRWRGAAPIHRAIEAGDVETGITIMQMDVGLDTGPMLMRQAMPIVPTDTTGTLHDRLAALGGKMIVAALQGLGGAGLTATPQSAEGVTYAAKIDKAEAQIDWLRPAAEIARMIRAFDPFPGAYGQINTVAIKVWHAEQVAVKGAPGEVIAAGPEGIVVACGEGGLRLLELQRPGSRRLSVGEFLRGFALVPGDRFAPASL